MSERDLGEWRARSGRGERGKRKYMYIYTIFSCLIQTQTHFIHLRFLYKVRKASQRVRSGRVASKIHLERGEITTVCYGIQLNQIIFIAFIFN